VTPRCPRVSDWSAWYALHLCQFWWNYHNLQYPLQKSPTIKLLCLWTFWALNDATCDTSNIDLNFLKIFVKFQFCATKWCDAFHWLTSFLTLVDISFLTSDLQRVSDLGARRRLRSSTTSALVAPRTVRATIADRAFPAAAAVHLSGTVCRRQYVHRRVIATFPQ